jgi:hypothetical protein
LSAPVASDWVDLWEPYERGFGAVVVVVPLPARRDNPFPDRGIDISHDHGEIRGFSEIDRAIGRRPGSSDNETSAANLKFLSDRRKLV